MPILKKPNPTTGKPAAKPTASGPQDDFARRYAATEPAKKGGFVPPEPGSYNALIVEGQYQRDGDETKAYIEVQIVDEDVPSSGKNCRIYYNFTKADGSDAGSMPYFRKDASLFGKDDEFTSEEDCAEFLAELAKAQIWVVINVVLSKGKYTNIYLDSVPENQSDKPALINP